MNRSIIFGTIRLCLLSVTVLLCACHTQIPAPKNLQQNEISIIVFETAESLFEQRHYTFALEAYFDYLKRFPHGSAADLALKRIATIHGYIGDQDAQLKTYRLLSAEYPDSQYAQDANYEIMMNFYNNDKFRQALVQAAKIIKESKSKNLLARTYIILGEIYVSFGSPELAVCFYSSAYSMADEIKKDYITNKIRTTFDLLDKKELKLLSNQIDDESIKGELFYKIAFIDYEKKDYHEAQKALLEFIQNYPQHKAADQAKLILHNIKQRLSFKRGLIGCILPLSGEYENFGKKALDGVRLALNNFKSMNKNYDINLIVRDTCSDPKTIASLVKDLDDRGVALIIGPMVTSKIAGIEAQKRGIPIITLTQKLGISEIGEYVFRNFLTPSLQVETLVSCAIDQFGVERFAILYPDEIYGRTFMNLFWEKVEYYGADVVIIENYPPDQTDFSTIIKKIANISENQKRYISAPHRMYHTQGRNQRKKINIAPMFDAIFIPDESIKIALIAPQLAYWDVNNVLLIGTNLWHSNQLIDMAKSYVQGAILTDVFYYQSCRNGVQHFVQTFENFYGRKAGFIEGLAYDTAMIAFQSSTDRNVNSRKNLKEKLLKTSYYDCATGLTSFEYNGDPKKELYLLQINGNKFIQLNSHDSQCSDES
jgi:ABC-type branched-subunit amino acid transport system substrate-binding protein/TolA-binding protein